MADLTLPLAFLLGSIPWGLLIGKQCGVDVRSQGSGNIGATNVWRICGWKAGLSCFILDVLKGVVPTILGRCAAPELPWLHVGCAMLAVLGHSFSPWLGWKGGKGVATSLGVFLALDWIAALSGFGAWAALVAITRYVSVASMLGVMIAGIAAAVQPAVPVPYRVAFWLGFVLVVVRHRANLTRLLRGEENKIGRKQEPAQPAPEPAEETGGEA